MACAAQAVWAVCCPCLGVALLVGTFTRGPSAKAKCADRSPGQISMFARKISLDKTAALEQEKSPGAPAEQPPAMALEGA